MTLIYLERREPARNRLRFYNIAVTQTLFDGWALVRKTEGAARAAGEQWRMRKEKWGRCNKG